MEGRFGGLIDDLGELLKGQRDVAAGVVFGSVARGEADSRSDLDLCIIMKKDVRKRLSDRILSLEKKHDISINVVFTDLVFSGVDRYLVETLLKEGVPIFGKLPDVPVQRLELEPYEIIKYDLLGLEQSDKMRLKRALYGMVTKRKYQEKTYESKKTGLVEELKALRIGRASVLVPEKESHRVEKLLRDYHVKYRKITIWLSRA